MLDSRWAARPLALSHYRDRVALVLDDAGGQPLDQMLGQPLALPDFLRIAISLAVACRHMHASGLVHKDIKPANVLVDGDLAGVRLTGFGIAARPAAEPHDSAPPEIIAGTLAYMAPEQTGRVNRSVDSRSDLYALGVTFYEMLTGAPPFTAADPLELIHGHIARQPVPPHQRLATIPAAVSLIVLKLLAKTMEERYQTAAGLEADLRHCLADWQVHGRVAPFAIGTHDTSDRLRIPETLYGREREIDTLLAAFERVASSAMPELVLVSGYSGIGKSAVVDALRKELTERHALFATGKFDQYKRDIPYATLAQAFQGQVRFILGLNDSELARWRDVIAAALGPNGQLMVNLIAELELVIGPQPPLPDLPPAEAQIRFRTVFRRFVGAFARPERPLVLFLDDLQWLDDATLDLVQHLIAHEGVPHLMVVGAYRDTEVDPAHALAAALDEIRAAGTPVHEIVLSPLGLDDIARLIAEALRCTEQLALPIAELVHEKAGGNPFFTTQFLTELAEEKLLRRDEQGAAWSWDLPLIRDKGYTDNILDLMGAKLNRLPAASQEALKQLACLGHVADLATLAVLRGQPEDALHAALAEVVRSGLLIQMNSAYRFAHDRVHEAAYTLIPEAGRAEAHLRIGRRLLEQRCPPGRSRKASSTSSISSMPPARFCATRPSGSASQSSICGRPSGPRPERPMPRPCAISRSAWIFLARMPGSSDTTSPSPSGLEGAECEYLNGDFETTRRLISEVLSRARSTIDKAAAYRILIIFHSADGRVPRGHCPRPGVPGTVRDRSCRSSRPVPTSWRNTNGSGPICRAARSRTSSSCR